MICSRLRRGRRWRQPEKRAHLRGTGLFTRQALKAEVARSTRCLCVQDSRNMGCRCTLYVLCTEIKEGYTFRRSRQSVLQSLIDLNLDLCFELVLLGAVTGSYALGFLEVGANSLRNENEVKNTRFLRIETIPRRRKLPGEPPR